MAEKKTMVLINQTTANGLKEKKITRRDTYDEVITRLLEKERQWNENDSGD